MELIIEKVQCASRLRKRRRNYIDTYFFSEPHDGTEEITRTAREGFFQCQMNLKFKIHLMLTRLNHRTRIANRQASFWVLRQRLE